MVVQLHGDVSDEALDKAVRHFIGEIYQRPPLRSRVKRSVRRRRIHSIELIERSGRLLLLKVLSDPGTYMRKLAHDLGLLLGVGAHMRELRRTRTGPFKEDETLVTFQEVEEALALWREQGDERYLRRVVLPVETAIVHLPKIVMLDGAVSAVAHGASLAAPGVARLTEDVRAGGTVALLTLKGELVALGRAVRNAEEIAGMEKGIVARVTRVCMDPGLYKPRWKK